MLTRMNQKETGVQSGEKNGSRSAQIKKTFAPAYYIWQTISFVRTNIIRRLKSG